MKVIYDYEDMAALREMTPKEAIKILMDVYKVGVGKWVLPQQSAQYFQEDFDVYQMQCAFILAWKALSELENAKKDEYGIDGDCHMQCKETYDDYYANYWE